MRIDHGDHPVHGEETGIEKSKLLYSEITAQILDAAIHVHRTLGPGLLESAYEICLFHELVSRGLQVQRQVDLPIRYNNVVLESGYRIDMIVEGAVILEIKSIDKLIPLHDAQLLSYLKLANVRVGLLINFNVQTLKEGIRRKVL